MGCKKSRTPAIESLFTCLQIPIFNKCKFSSNLENMEGVHLLEMQSPFIALLYNDL